MIAPLRKSLSQLDPSQRDARRRAASLLPESRASHQPKAIPAWQAWLTVAWLAIVAVCYIVSMLRSGA